MSCRAVTRKRVLIWAFVKLFLTLCDRQTDARAASFDQPLALSISIAQATGKR